MSNSEGNINYFTSYELSSDDDNIRKVLKEDRFGRKNYIVNFIKLLDNIDYHCTIAVDGPWGSGKTFFVKQAACILEDSNSVLCTGDNSALNRINGLVNSFLPVYYDAWENDNVNDPILSLIYTIINNKNFERDNLLIEKKSFLKRLAAFTDMISGRGISDFWEKTENQDQLSTIDSAKKAKEEIKNFLSSCLTEKADKLVIFIDELDRCKPDFAVKVLERIKHYFDCENIIFVLSVNTAELIHTIKVFYGSNFDACRYLDRFIDFRVNIPSIPLKQYLKSLNVYPDNTVQASVAAYLAEKYKMSLREVEKYFRAINATTGKLCDSDQRYIRHALMFYYSYILPIMLALKSIDIEKYELFTAGKYFEILKEIFEKCDLLHNACSMLELRANDENILKILEEKYISIFKSDDKVSSYIEIAGLISDLNSQSYQER